MVDQRPLAERQQRLEGAHARGEAGGQNDRHDRRGRIALGALSHALALLPRRRSGPCDVGPDLASTCMRRP